MFSSDSNRVDNLVPPQGIEPQPLLLQSSAPTMYAREALDLLEEHTILFPFFKRLSGIILPTLCITRCQWPYASTIMCSSNKSITKINFSGMQILLLRNDR